MESSDKDVTSGENRILSIRFAAPGGQLRRLVSRSNAKPTGKYPSIKTGGMLQWQSINERNAFKFLDACSAVRSYAAQFVEIRFVLDGECRSHFPDVYVIFADNQEMWEVKTRKFALEQTVLRRTKFLTEALPKHGYQYRVVLAEDLSREPRLSTISKLLDLGRTQIPLVERERLRRLLSGMSSFRWDDVAREHFGEKSSNYIARLILEGELQIDFEQELNGSTQVSHLCDINQTRRHFPIVNERD